MLESNENIKNESPAQDQKIEDKTENTDVLRITDDTIPIQETDLPVLKLSDTPELKNNTVSLEDESVDFPINIPAESVSEQENLKPVQILEKEIEAVSESQTVAQTDKGPDRLKKMTLTDPYSSLNISKALSNEEVTNHTATLWKYFPIPAKEPEPAPEYIHGTAIFPGSKVIAARVRGKKHKHEGTNCDDWYEVANYERITFVAVSDGAGSKKFSRIGARESCKAAIGYLVSSFEKLFADQPDLNANLSLALTDARCMET